MKIGCFALVKPFCSMKDQFTAIKNMGFEYADLTDSHDGASLGVEFGFSATTSLDSHPQKIRDMLGDTELTLTSVCAHANLFDATSPDVYGTAQIIKAVRLAHHMGIKQVITTEGDPKTPFGHSLTRDQQLFSIVEKLQTPLAWAEELDIEILLEPHGVLTDSVKGMQDILDALGHEKHLGVNLDTGNSWLGGAEPIDYIHQFGDRIKHVHWKDMGAEWLPMRGKQFGCGMGSIPVGDGLVGIKEVVSELKRSGFNGPTTLEVAGEESMLVSAQRLREWWEI